MNKYNQLQQYILNPNTKTAMDLAYWYINEYRNYSAAMTYLIKASEYNESTPDEVYECLMCMSSIYNIIGYRWKGTQRYATFAKTMIPDRPEAYLMLCESIAEASYLDKEMARDDWVFVYENSKIGLDIAEKNDREINFYYKGINYLKIYYCLSLLYLNQHKKLKEYLNTINFIELRETRDETLLNTFLFIYNELRLEYPGHVYKKEYIDKLKIRFDGVEDINNNYSQVMQDWFVLTMLNGKKNGTYLEIGAGDPIYGNNTKLLEELGWKGLSIDWSQEYLSDFIEKRENKIINVDAVNTNYNDLLPRIYKSNIIDYLSLDIDPSENTLNCLCQLPLDKYIFNVITFEHDFYLADNQVKENSRKILESQGYKLIGRDIKCDANHTFEDWYIHKSIYNKNLSQKIDLLFKDHNGLVRDIFFHK